jgi:hypothetical protein
VTAGKGPLCRCGCGRTITKYTTVQLANACYERWRTAGRPDEIPDARPTAPLIREAGIENYLFIGGDRMSARQAAERLSVSMRTITRYRAVLRAGAAA